MLSKDQIEEMLDNNEELTSSQAAQALGLTRLTVLRYLRTGILEGRKVGLGVVRYDWRARSSSVRRLRQVMEEKYGTPA